MKSHIRFITILISSFLFIKGEAQNCLKCVDTEYETSSTFTLLSSRFHLLQLFGDNSFHSTNFYNTNYNGNVGWFESRLIFPAFSHFIKSKVPLPDLYFTGIIKDLKDIYWEKRFDYGVGIEWRPFKQIDKNLMGFNWIKHLRLYSVVLKGKYFQAIESWRPNKDFRSGFELYRECNIYNDYKLGERNDDNHYFWGEIWSDFSYRETNFFINDYNSWFFALAPKYGLKLFPYKIFTLMPYITGDLVLTSRSDFWQNRALLGIGIRMMPFRKFSTGNFSNFFRSCRLYCEYNNSILYFKDKPIVGTPKYDLKFGSSFSIFR